MNEPNIRPYYHSHTPPLGEGYPNKIPNPNHHTVTQTPFQTHAKHLPFQVDLFMRQRISFRVDFNLRQRGIRIAS